MNSKTTETKLAEALRALVAVIREGYESDDPHGALDQIAEHAEGAAATLAEHDAKPAAKPAARFRVRWEIDSDAMTPRDAAREAWAAMRREDSIACFFEVTNRKGNAVAVDLQHENARKANAKPAPGLAALCHALADALQERRAAGAFRGLYASQRETLAALQDMARFVGDEVEAEPARYGDAPNA